MSKQETIPFRLAAIHTREFATFEDHLDNHEGKEELDGGLRAGMNYVIDHDHAAVECSFKAEILISKEVIIVIEVACEFDIEPKAWAAMRHDNQLIIPMGLAQHLGVITVGTTRGVLHAKTDNTPFNKFYLPTVSVAEMVLEDVDFELD